jgi:hypothetical protein
VNRCTRLPRGALGMSVPGSPHQKAAPTVRRDAAELGDRSKETTWKTRTGGLTDDGRRMSTTNGATDDRDMLNLRGYARAV